MRSRKLFFAIKRLRGLKNTGKSNQFSTQELLWFFCGFYLVYDRNPFLEKVPFFHIGKFAIPCVEF